MRFDDVAATFFESIGVYAEAERMGFDSPCGPHVLGDLGRGRVRVVGDGGFDVLEHDDPAGEPVALLLARDEFGEPVDIVAASPDLQRIRGRWTGRAWALGADTMHRLRIDVDALPVHRSPREWLSAGREGVVILTSDAEMARQRLLSAGPLMVTDTAFGRDLERFLIWRPEILVAAKMGPKL